MRTSLDRKRTELEDLCRRYRVRRLEVFGSAAKEGQGPDPRDLDFLVEFQPLEPGQHADAYFGLLDGLEDLFGCSVDLVMERAVRNPYFRRSIERTRRVVYAP